MRALIVDDEANLRKVLSTLLGQVGHHAVTADNGQAALELVRDEPFDLVITDLRMPGMDGLALLDAIKELDPALPVIMMTAHGTVETAVSALKRGAFDYITKPFDKEELQRAVRRAGSARQSCRKNGGRYDILGKSSAMEKVFELIDRVAQTPSTVLITGESGTGKELVANAIHARSQRAGAPLIKVNCAAIPKDLLESEFFGYEKGAFTGAVAQKPGRFELADGGTLFLDEIAEIPIDMQVKLLRALQESEFERVGGVRTIAVNVRVIAATNRHLPTEIAAGTFREDLYYRLNVVPIHLPALRDRREDIPLLVDAFVARLNARLGRHVERVSPAALAALCGYNWPGNIRELENVMERAMLFTDGSAIEPAALPEYVRTSLREGDPAAPSPEAMRAGATMRDIVRQATVELERDLIQKALDETAGNVTKAAALLGISRKGLQLKMKDLALRDPPGKS